MAIVIFGWIMLGTLVGFALVQSTYVWLHCRFLKSKVAAALDDTYVPRVAVVLCVRGWDPSLIRCLAGLAQQNYANSEIHVVADHWQDPALQTVQDFFSDKKLAAPTIHVLKEHSQSRSLKCSAIIAAISELDDSIGVVALIDADAVPDPGWLKDLVRPLSDPAVGVTTGNRWFAPARKNLAAYVRQAWNAAAVCQMTAYQIPWGGSLALKRSTIDRCKLLEHWSNAFCEDTMLTKILKSNQLRMVRVPNLVLANDESTTMSGTFRWIVRQLLTVRLYHRDWPLVVLHGSFLGGCMIAVLVAIGLLFLNGEPKLGSLLMVMLVMFEIGYAGLFVAIQAANLGAVNQRRSSTDQADSNSAKMIALLVTQFLYPFAVLRAATARRVSWRGIDYAIGPGQKITMLDYRPYHESLDQEQESSQNVTSVG